MRYGTNLSVRIATAVALVGCVRPSYLAAQRNSIIQYHLVVTVIGDQPLANVQPRRDWGAALDGHELAEATNIYTPRNISAMKSAGLGPITYRLRTELGIDTWHWNPEGRWSDPERRQGYWISSDSASQPIEQTFGYRLPRRGRTIDDAANEGYSRIDDGDTTTFWKTNPYLDPRFTHDPESEHPQWFVVDLGTAVPIGEVHFLWGAPFPQRFIVEYWTGDQSQPIDYNPDGSWRRFEHGLVTGGRGGSEDLQLATAPVTTRFLRVIMYESSHTAAGGNGDPRDSLGFALRELFAGDRDAAGGFHDKIRHHTTAMRQSAMLVSSTDPWHREIDRDSTIVQPGFDLIMKSGLTNHLPMLVPTGLLFDTPENAAAELRFLRSRGYPIEGIELGEEPDGQRITPEDHASLYLQFAAALDAVDVNARLGGPSWQNLLNDPLVLWPTRASPGARATPIGRFLDYLDVRGRSGDYRFLSFEWYPFDDVCSDPAGNLAAAPGLLRRDLARLDSAGVPDSIPRIMTEYGYSAHLSLAEVTMPAALFDADLVAGFFAHGGFRSFYFGYEPGGLGHERACPQWGNLVMFLADTLGRVRYRMPRYYGTWLLTHAWADSTGGDHVMHAVRVARAGVTVDDSLLSTYALRRPDGRWSLLLVNRDPRHSRVIDVLVPGAGASNPAVRPLDGPVDLWQYSGAQYQFHEDGMRGHPVRDLPPGHRVVPRLTSVTLPSYSLTVIAGW
jgi:hypothetical protein